MSLYAAIVDRATEPSSSAMMYDPSDLLSTMTMGPVYRGFAFRDHSFSIEEFRNSTSVPGLKSKSVIFAPLSFSHCRTLFTLEA